jgi:hypothetical protein
MEEYVNGVSLMVEDQQGYKGEQADDYDIKKHARVAADTWRR